MKKNVRLRVLFLMELFVSQTDSKHGVTMSDMLEWLEEHDLTAERKRIPRRCRLDIYEDIRALKEYGLEIEYFKEDRTYRMLG